MDKVSIKRAKRNKKKPGFKEKALAGVGLASAVVGGGGVRQQPITSIVRTKSQDETSVTGKIRAALGRIFGAQKAEAEGLPVISFTNSAGQNLNGSQVQAGQNWRIQITGLEGIDTVFAKGGRQLPDGSYPTDRTDYAVSGDSLTLEGTFAQADEGYWKLDWDTGDPYSPFATITFNIQASYSVSSIAFEASTINLDASGNGSFTTSFFGTNLPSDAQFDVRMRRASDGASWDTSYGQAFQIGITGAHYVNIQNVGVWTVEAIRVRPADNNPATGWVSQTGKTLTILEQQINLADLINKATYTRLEGLTGPEQDAFRAHFINGQNLNDIPGKFAAASAFAESLEWNTTLPQTIPGTNRRYILVDGWWNQQAESPAVNISISTDQNLAPARVNEYKEYQIITSVGEGASNYTNWSIQTDEATRAALGGDNFGVANAPDETGAAGRGRAILFVKPVTPTAPGQVYRITVQVTDGQNPISKDFTLAVEPTSQAMIENVLLQDTQGQPITELVLGENGGYFRTVFTGQNLNDTTQFDIQMTRNDGLSYDSSLYSEPFQSGAVGNHFVDNTREGVWTINAIRIRYGTDPTTGWVQVNKTFTIRAYQAPPPATISQARINELLANINTILYRDTNDADRTWLNSNPDQIRARLLTGNFSSFQRGSIMAWALSMGEGTALSADARSLGFVNYDSASDSFNKVAPPQTVFSISGDLPEGEVGSAYGDRGLTTNLTGDLTWSIASGALPQGLDLNPASGIVSGTPTQDSSYTFTVEVMDSQQQTATKQYTVVIRPAPNNTQPLAITTVSLPSVTAGNYSQQLSATGGSGQRYWLVAPATGQLPAGVTLNTSTGLLSGTVAAGVYNFTIEVRDNLNPQLTPARQAYILTVTAQTPAPVVNNAVLTFSNATNPNQALKVGDRSRIVISNAPRDTKIWITAQHDSGQAATWDYGRTDGNGNWTLDSEPLIDRDIGNWTITVKVGNDYTTATEVRGSPIAFTVFAAGAAPVAPVPLNIQQIILKAKEGGLSSQEWQDFTAYFADPDHVNDIPADFKAGSAFAQLFNLTGAEGAERYIRSRLFRLESGRWREKPAPVINIGAIIAKAAQGSNLTQSEWQDLTAHFAANRQFQDLPAIFKANSALAQLLGWTSLPVNTERVIGGRTYKLNASGMWQEQNPAPAAAPVISTAADLPNAAVGVYYTAFLEVSGGTGPYRWFPVGALPPGINLVESQRASLQGTFTSVGAHTFTLRARDSQGRETTKTFTLRVNSTGQTPPSQPPSADAPTTSPRQRTAQARYTNQELIARIGTIIYSQPDIPDAQLSEIQQEVLNNLPREFLPGSVLAFMLGQGIATTPMGLTASFGYVFQDGKFIKPEALLPAAELTQAQISRLLGKANTLIFTDLEGEEIRWLIQHQGDVLEAVRTIADRQGDDSNFKLGSIMAWRLGMGENVGLSDAAKGFGYEIYDPSIKTFLKGRPTTVQPRVLERLIDLATNYRLDEPPAEERLSEREMVIVGSHFSESRDNLPQRFKALSWFANEWLGAGNEEPTEANGVLQKAEQQGYEFKDGWYVKKAEGPSAGGGTGTTGSGGGGPGTGNAGSSGGSGPGTGNIGSGSGSPGGGDSLLQYSTPAPEDQILQDTNNPNTENGLRVTRSGNATYINYGSIGESMENPEIIKDAGGNIIWVSGKDSGRFDVELVRAGNGWVHVISQDAYGRSVITLRNFQGSRIAALNNVRLTRNSQGRIIQIEGQTVNGLQLALTSGIAGIRLAANMPVSFIPRDGDSLLFLVIQNGKIFDTVLESWIRAYEYAQKNNLNDFNITQLERGGLAKLTVGSGPNQTAMYFNKDGQISDNFAYSKETGRDRGILFITDIADQKWVKYGERYLQEEKRIKDGNGQLITIVGKIENQEATLQLVGNYWLEVTKDANGVFSAKVLNNTNGQPLIAFTQTTIVIDANGSVNEIKGSLNNQRFVFAGGVLNPQSGGQQELMEITDTTGVKLTMILLDGKIVQFTQGQQGVKAAEFFASQNIANYVLAEIEDGVSLAFWGDAGNVQMAFFNPSGRFEPDRAIAWNQSLFNYFDPRTNNAALLLGALMPRNEFVGLHPDAIVTSNNPDFINNFANHLFGILSGNTDLSDDKGLAGLYIPARSLQLIVNTLNQDGASDNNFAVEFLLNKGIISNSGGIYAVTSLGSGGYAVTSPDEYIKIHEIERHGGYFANPVFKAWVDQQRQNLSPGQNLFLTSALFASSYAAAINPSEAQSYSMTSSEIDAYLYNNAKLAAVLKDDRLVNNSNLEGLLNNVEAVLKENFDPRFIKIGSLGVVNNIGLLRIGDLFIRITANPGESLKEMLSKAQVYSVETWEMGTNRPTQIAFTQNGVGLVLDVSNLNDISVDEITFANIKISDPEIIRRNGVVVGYQGKDENDRLFIMAENGKTTIIVNEADQTFAVLDQYRNIIFSDSYLSLEKDGDKIVSIKGSNSIIKTGNIAGFAIQSRDPNTGEFTRIILDEDLKPQFAITDQGVLSAIGLPFAGSVFNASYAGSGAWFGMTELQMYIASLVRGGGGASSQSRFAE